MSKGIVIFVALMILPVAFCLAVEGAEPVVAGEAVSDLAVENRPLALQEEALDAMTDDLLIPLEENSENLSDEEGEEKKSEEVDPKSLRQFIALGGGFEEFDEEDGELEQGAEKEERISPERAAALLVDDPTLARKYAKYLNPIAAGDHGNFIPVGERPSYAASHWIQTSSGSWIAPPVGSNPSSPPFAPESPDANRPSYAGDNWIPTEGGSWIAPLVEAPAITPETLGISPQSIATAARPDYAGENWVQAQSGSWIAPVCPNNSC